MLVSDSEITVLVDGSGNCNNWANCKDAMAKVFSDETKFCSSFASVDWIFNKSPLYIYTLNIYL